MKIQYFKTPRPHFIIDNLFGKIINKKILDEAINLKQHFKESTIGKNINIKTSFRNNMVIYYDEFYVPPLPREKSVLLTAINKLFNNNKFSEILSTSAYPIVDFNQTSYHETQVSRYGDNGQKYKWHVDRFDHSKRRHISLIYYFFKEPKKFNGGNLEITDSPIYDGKPILKNPEIKTIEPKNDMCIVFGGYTPHQVLPTTSPKKFGNGRFSSNIWIGFN